jgi:RNA polymerase sigma factor (sigma-70 family)
MDSLLRHLNPDPAKAEERLLAIRRKVLKFFTYRQQLDPEGLTQETLRRAVRWFENKDNQLQASNPEQLIWGIAKNILREEYRALNHQPDFVELDEADRRLTAREAAPELKIFLAELLASLPAKERRVLKAYLLGDAESRQEMAAKLGKTQEALRAAVFQSRRKLRKLANEKIKRKGPSTHKQRDDR